MLSAKEELEGFYGITITDDDLRAAVRRRNRLRAAQLEMFALQVNQPAAMSGVDLMSTMFAGTFSFDIEAYTQQLEQKVAKLREAYDAGERPVAADAKRILITEGQERRSTRSAAPSSPTAVWSCAWTTARAIARRP